MTEIERSPIEVTPPPVITLAAEIQAEVNARLKFKFESVHIDDIENEGRQLANCMGFTRLGSVMLQGAGIDHYVVFMNGNRGATHGTTFIPTSERALDPEGLWLFDVLDSEVTQPLKGPLMAAPSKAGENRWVARVNGSRIQAYAHRNPNGNNRNYRWFKAPGADKGVKTTQSQHSKIPRVNSLVATIYRPEQGREIIYNFAKFHEMYAESRFDEAGDYLIAMHGNFPNIDLRSNMIGRIKDIVKRLAAGGDYEKAHAATEAFFSSMPSYVNDSRINEYHADCLRYIADFSGHTSLGQRALHLYEIARAHPKSFTDAITDKIELCKVY